MSFVVDASIAAAWVLPDEKSAEADVLLDRLQAAPAVIPSLFWFEVCNLLLIAERRGRLKVGGAVDGMAELRRLGLLEAAFEEDLLVLTLALRHALSAYDASYLALSLRQQLPLATKDKKLVAAALAEAVLVLGMSAP